MVTEKFAVGLYGSYMNNSLYGDADIGAAASYYFNTPYKDSSFLTFYSSYTSVEAEQTFSTINETLKADLTGASFGLLYGYHWIWEHFNVQFKAGVVYVTIKDPVVQDSSGNNQTVDVGYSGLTYDIHFTLGWMF